MVELHESTNACILLRLLSAAEQISQWLQVTKA